MKHWFYCARCHVWHDLEYTAGITCPTCGIEFEEYRMDRLKPCPFCGKIPIMVRSGIVDTQGRESYDIQCVNGECACMPVSWFYPTQEEAIEAWNRRAGEQE